MPDTEQSRRRILLAVTGLTPQIVTETIYALAVARTPRWVPDEVHLITTRKGALKAQAALLSEEGGWFHRLVADYGLPRIAFGQESIHVVSGPEGDPLEDILSGDHNGRVADFITEQVRRLTADPDTILHVSIAGGRKTMGFHAGHALSLFGRPQDRLSHVLVSPPFESLEEFYYPSPVPRIIKDREKREVDAREAQIHLGEIPFVRLREWLPKRLLHGQAAFSETVAGAQQALQAPALLRLEPGRRTVAAAGQSLVLDASPFALYWMLAERRVAGHGGIRRDDKGLGNDLLRYYGRLVPQHSAQYARTEEAYRRFDVSNFDQAKSKINGTLKEELGERSAGPYLIDRVEPVPGTRMYFFGLALQPEAIEIELASLQVP